MNDEHEDRARSVLPTCETKAHYHVSASAKNAQRSCERVCAATTPASRRRVPSGPRARKGPDRVSGCHGAGADERFSCRMIMRSLNATVPCGDRLPAERSPVTGQVVDPFQDVADLCQIVRYAYWRASGHRAGGNDLGGWQ